MIIPASFDLPIHAEFGLAFEEFAIRTPYSYVDRSRRNDWFEMMSLHICVCSSFLISLVIHVGAAFMPGMFTRKIY